MFRQQQPAARKPRAKAGPRPFVDFINWTDYHWESNTWRSAATMPWAQGARQPRRYTFLQVFLAGRSPEAHGGAKEQRGADEQRAEK
jgi:hypothetical protein